MKKAFEVSKTSEGMWRLQIHPNTMNWMVVDFEDWFQAVSTMRHLMAFSMPTAAEEWVPVHMFLNRAARA